MSGPTATASARSSASRWPCATKAKKSPSGTRIPSRRNTNFSTPKACFKNRSAAKNLTASSPPTARASSGWARPASASGDRKIFINIDHHESNPRYGDVNWVSPREPSCGELIYRLIKVARWPITKPIADLLFTAISTDTGSFQYATTRPGTFHAGAELVTRGANLAKICDEVYQSYPVSRAKLLQARLQQIPPGRPRPHRVVLAEAKRFRPHRRGERRHGRLD